MPATSAASNKENRVPASAPSSSSSFALTGKPTTAAAASRGRKPAAAAANRAARSTNKGKRSSSSSGDDDDELMMEGGGEDEETVVVAETQVGQGGDGAATTGAKNKKTRKAPAANGRAGTKKGALPSGLEDEATDDFDAALTGPGPRPPSAREKKLEAQLAATKKALAEQQAAFKKLSELRETRAEEAEQRLREISDERIKSAGDTIQAYKSESDALRSELSALHSTAFASPRSKAALVESTRVGELERERDEVRAELERERGERSAEIGRVERGERERARGERERLEKEVAELREEVSTLRTELNAEVAHSKSLQQQLKSAPSASSSTTLPLPASSLPSGAAAADTLKLQEEVERLTQKLNLNEDLTGFAVHSVKQEDMGAAYVCLLSDCAGTTGALNFKLTFHPDGTTSYKPNLEPERDAALVQLLSTELQGYMRFPAEMSSEFFKRLFASVNKVRI